MSVFETNLDTLGRAHASALDVLRRESLLNGEVPGRCEVRAEGVVLHLPPMAELSFCKTYSLGQDVQNRFLLICGFGDGRIVREAVRAGASDILVFEPSPQLFACLLKGMDIRDVLSHPRVRIILGHESGNWLRDLNIYFDEDASRLARGMQFKSVQEPIESAQPELAAIMQNFSNFFAQEIRAKADRFKPNEEDTYRGLMNTLRNFPEYYRNARLNDLAGLHAGKTGVSVSTGPSLKYSIPWLKKYQDQLVIFCADSAVRILLREGITPHYVGCLERIMGTSTLVQNLPPLPQTYFVAPPVVWPKTFASYPGPVLRLERDVSFDNWIYDTGRIGDNLGSSVSHLCYVGLRVLGCDTVFLVGQDSAYDPHTRQSHVASADPRMLKHGQWLRDEVSNVSKTEVDGFGGRKQLTMHFWFQNTQIFDRLITERGGKVYNVIPEEYGIPIPKTKRLHPDEAFPRFAGETFVRGEAEVRCVAACARGAELEQSGRGNLRRIREYLREFSSRAMAVLQEISTFWLDHDVCFMREFLPDYQTFFKHMEEVQGGLASDANPEFMRILYPLVQSVYINTGLRFAEAVNIADPARRAEEQMQMLMQFYALMHLWSMRALALLETQNQERWHEWST